MRILLVEDDRTIASGLDYSLTQGGYEVAVASCVTRAVEMMNETEFDLYLLDLTLPDGSGYDICRRVKEKADRPVVFLTACDEEINVVTGLDMGADDYITKPFRIREVLSRIKSVLRRYQKSDPGKTVLRVGDIRVNTQEAKVYKGDREVLLTALEYRLLLTLLRQEGCVLSRSQLLEGIWDIAGDFVNDNTLTVYIKRLRDKLEDEPASPRLIHTVRGLGYKAGGRDDS